MTAAEPQDELMKACPYRGLVPYFENDAEFFSAGKATPASSWRTA